MELSAPESASVGELATHVADLFERFGQRKPMSQSAPSTQRPHFFLLRDFLAENDLLVIFNTKRCRYQCAFCQLPAKSSLTWVPHEEVVAQFRYVVDEVRHALSILDRVTLSNEGSVLDSRTLDPAALLDVMKCVGVMRRVRRVELETRLEFVQPELMRELKAAVPRARLGILTGFETHDERIRDTVLKKRESLFDFCMGLDRVAEAGASLSAYVLFKPDPAMSDEEGREEAQNTIAFLGKECERRGIEVTVRLNPMYRAAGSRWADVADATKGYAPPRLSDVIEVAQQASSDGIRTYIGLSSEGLADPNGTYFMREDYSPALLKNVKLFNSGVVRPTAQVGLDNTPHDAARRSQDLGAEIGADSVMSSRGAPRAGS